MSYYTGPAGSKAFVTLWPGSEWPPTATGGTKLSATAVGQSASSVFGPWRGGSYSEVQTVALGFQPRARGAIEYVEWWTGSLAQFCKPLPAN